MGDIDYEALIEKRAKRDEAEQKDAADKLAEIAHNLQTLHELAEAQAKAKAKAKQENAKQEPEPTTVAPVAPPPKPPEPSEPPEE